MASLPLSSAWGALALVAACGGSSDAGDAGAPGNDAGNHPTDGGPSSDGGGGSDASSDPCHVDPAGAAFTFHVKNTRATDVYLDFGCGNAVPLELTTASGTLGIGPGDADFCGFSCDQVYQGHASGSCSDCGNPPTTLVAAGATYDLAWDHRAYVASQPNAACVPQNAATPPTCALGKTVPASATQAGTLKYCTGSSMATCGTKTPVTFTVDTTGTEATITIP